MKILSKEEEDAHYNEVLRGGFLGGGLGFGVGMAASLLAQKRSPFYRQLTLPMKAFLVSSSLTFAAIINADRASRSFEAQRTAGFNFEDKTAKLLRERQAQMTGLQKAKEWGREHRYPIVGASWVASMGAAFAIVSRDKYLTGPQKLVQARVYAQGLTLLVLIATAAFEIADQREAKEHPELVVRHEAYRGEDQWKDMVEAEERRLAARKAEAQAAAAGQKQ